MGYIDLHTHSTASDGTYTPADLTRLAAKAGLTAFALTDHDTVRGIPAAMQEAEKLKKDGIPIRVIPGVEISAGYNKSDIHILGLFIDYTHTPLITALAASETERGQRNEKMAANLRNAGISVTLPELRREDEEAVLTRAHFAKLLLKKGYVKTVKEAFVRYLGDDSPYYVGRNYPSPEDAIAMITNAGGIPVLAHPLLYHLSEKELNRLLVHLKEAGLKGIEAIYSNNINNEEAFVRSLARKYELFITGGSDFHGAIKPAIQIGTGKGSLKIPESLLEQFPI